MHHLKTLRVFNFVQAALAGLAGVIFLVLFLLPGFIEVDEEVPVWLFALMGVVGFILFEGFAVAHGLTGFLVTSGRGRLLQTCLALGQLFSFPIGTVYAIYALWVCWINEPTRRRFDSDYHPPIS